MKLTVAKIKSIKPSNKNDKYADGNGLYLLVKKSGAKLWRYNYRFNGKQKTYPYGVYPIIGLKDARELHLEVKQKLAQGIDPMHEKRVAKILGGVSQQNSFEFVATEFVESRKVKTANGKARWGKSASDRNEGRLKNYVYPYIGKMPIADIAAPEVLAMLRNIESRGYYETAHKVRGLVAQIFDYGISSLRCVNNPAAKLGGALIPYRGRSYPAITEPEKIGQLLRDIDVYSGFSVTRFALRLAPLVMLRPKELRHAEKSEFDLENMLWTIPADKMKKERDHLIPLSTQAVHIVSEAFKWSHPKSVYLFPALTTPSRPMSENTINDALRRMGYEKEVMTGHGFRSMASTLLNEQGYNRDWVEMQLAHVDKNKVRLAYNRAQYLPQRRQMLQEWADYLDGLRLGVYNSV